jgi:hypothetical protein
VLPRDLTPRQARRASPTIRLTTKTTRYTIHPSRDVTRFRKLLQGPPQETPPPKLRGAAESANHVQTVTTRATKMAAVVALRAQRAVRCCREYSGDGEGTFGIGSGGSCNVSLYRVILRGTIQEFPEAAPGDGGPHVEYFHPPPPWWRPSMRWFRGSRRTSLRDAANFHRCR